MAYVVSKFSKYHSSVLGSCLEASHTDLIILPNGDRVECDQEKRVDAIWQNAESGKSYVFLHSQVKFKILSESSNCYRTESKIRWSVPKGSKLVWRKWDYAKSDYEAIEKEIVV